MQSFDLRLRVGAEYIHWSDTNHNHLALFKPEVGEAVQRPKNSFATL